MSRKKTEQIDVKPLLRISICTFLGYEAPLTAGVSPRVATDSFLYLARALGYSSANTKIRQLNEWFRFYSSAPPGY